MYKITCVFLMFLVAACTSPSTTATGSTNVADSGHALIMDSQRTTAPSPINYTDSILGNWSDGTDENATIHVMADSILYISHMDKYKYQIQADSIKIYFTNSPVAAKMFFKADTLFWFSNTDTTKLWRFN